MFIDYFPGPQSPPIYFRSFRFFLLMFKALILGKERRKTREAVNKGGKEGLPWDLLTWHSEAIRKLRNIYLKQWLLMGLGGAQFHLSIHSPIHLSVSSSVPFFPSFLCPSVHSSTCHPFVHLLRGHLTVSGDIFGSYH